MTYTLDPMQPQFDRALVWNNDAGRMTTYHRRHPLSLALEQAWMRRDQFQDAWRGIAAYLAPSERTDWFEIACGIVVP